jgi:hypothetical protein
MNLLGLPRIARFSRSAEALLPLDMFSYERTREEASRARRLETLYHIGQEKIWDGRKVLKGLSERYGKISIPDEPRRALAKVFSIIMWGELAAWKVSAQLAEQIVPLEAKMAATSQAHDEARHFYVMHDYLELLGLTPPPLEFWSRSVVEMAIGTDDLAQKLAGMQLQVETIALTIFHKVRELHVEPVLSELLQYFELDEARHVGLGVQYLPDLIRKMSTVEHTRFVLFQLRLLLYSLAGLKHIEKDLASLGINARELIEFGAKKQLSFLNDLAQVTGQNPTQEWTGRIFDAACEVVFPSRGQAHGVSVRAALWRALGAVDVLTGRLEGIARPMRRAAAESAARAREARRRERERLPILL